MVFIDITKTDYLMSNQRRFIELIIYASSAFLIPFLLGHPQWLVGILVNTSLVLAGLNLKKHNLLPVIILPSIAVLTKGLIFGPFTVFLLYFIPSIWIGNALLTLSMKLKMNKWIKLTMGVASKTVLLGVTALVLVNFNVVPELFLAVMGLTQLYTAIGGGFLAFSIHEIKKRALTK